MLDFKQVLTRSQRLAIYIIDNQATIRETARVFGMSKTTVHKYVTKRLENVPERFVNGIDLYKEVQKVFDYNDSQKAIRGGMATKKKYKK